MKAPSIYIRDQSDGLDSTLQPLQLLHAEELDFSAQSKKLQLRRFLYLSSAHDWTRLPDAEAEHSS